MCYIKYTSSADTYITKQHFATSTEEVVKHVQSTQLLLCLQLPFSVFAALLMHLPIFTCRLEAVTEEISHQGVYSMGYMLLVITKCMCLLGVYILWPDLQPLTCFEASWCLACMAQAYPLPATLCVLRSCTCMSTYMRAPVYDTMNPFYHVSVEHHIARLVNPECNIVFLCHTILCVGWLQRKGIGDVVMPSMVLTKTVVTQANSSAL